MTIPKLTERQLEVAKMIQKGRSNKDIADALGIAENTVKVHIYRLCKLLGVKNRGQVVFAVFGTTPADSVIASMLLKGLFNVSNAIATSVPCNTPDEKKFHAYIRECAMFMQSASPQEGS